MAAAMGDHGIAQAEFAVEPAEQQADSSVEQETTHQDHGATSKGKGRSQAHILALWEILFIIQYPTEKINPGSDGYRGLHYTLCSQ